MDTSSGSPILAVPLMSTPNFGSFSNSTGSRIALMSVFLMLSSFSLRTSETSYLNEAFSFYSAIRQRSYYYQVNKEDRPELVVKKLRYYARFIVVCLLLNKMDLVKVLVKELSEEIEDYTQRFNTEDQLEWNLVLQEVAAFVEADPVIILNDDNAVVVKSSRLQEGGVPQLEPGMVVGQLTLADALIVGNCNSQVKFSELTIDMFRMLQALEREPVNLATQTTKPGTLEPNEKPAKRENPHKYLLYKPTFSQLYTFLSASFKNFCNLFGQPLVCLLSPTVYPKNMQDQSQHGSLFTLFLYNPLMGFLSVCGLTSMRQGLWDKAQEFVRKVSHDIGQMLTSSRTIDQAFLQFYGDEFLRLLMIRFVFCCATLRLHKLFREAQSFPESYPQLPKQEMVESSLLQKQIMELAAMLDVQNLFFDCMLDNY
ncbi:protein SCAI isoform X3 [Tachysurus ichikawai]